MAKAISPTNPGIIYDPRLRASQNYLAAVEKDLNQQAGEMGIGKSAPPVGNWMPMDRNLFNPRKHPHAFTRGLRHPAHGSLGVHYIA